MEDNEDNNMNNVAVLAILDDQNTVYKSNLTVTVDYGPNEAANEESGTGTGESTKQNIIWTKDATLTLLSLYESKIHMIDNPKKKSKMWTSMSEDLKTFNIEVTPDQVRWKINALTKKYKDSIDNGQNSSNFKYFNAMHQILGQRCDDSTSYRLSSGLCSLDGHDRERKPIRNAPFKRAERKAKIDLEKQWLEYLHRQEEQRQIRDERYERSLRLREEELELRKKELELKQTIALKKLQKQDEIIKIEREKCALLKKLIDKQELM